MFTPTLEEAGLEEATARTCSCLPMMDLDQWRVSLSQLRVASTGGYRRWPDGGKGAFLGKGTVGKLALKGVGLALATGAGF